MLIDQLPALSRDRFWDAPLKVLLAAALICLLAPIELGRTTALPITLQSLVVLIPAALLGPWRGSLAVLVYLIVGGLGLPVFAGGSSGWEKFASPTAGFLFGFLLAAIVTGAMANSRWALRWHNTALLLLTGHVVILACGFGWLAWFSGPTGLASNFRALLPGMYLKVAVGTLFLAGLNALMQWLVQRQASNP
jgi:biotin transport system substrate-specific component